ETVGDQDNVERDREFGAGNCLRFSPPFGVGIAQLHSDAARFGDVPGSIGREGDWIREEEKSRAFFNGVEILLPAAGHVLEVAAINAGCFGGAGTKARGL